MTNFHGDEAILFYFFLKISHKLCVRIDGTQYYDGLQPEMRAGIINEHECRQNKNVLWGDVCKILDSKQNLQCMNYE